MKNNAKPRRQLMNIARAVVLSFVFASAAQAAFPIKRTFYTDVYLKLLDEDGKPIQRSSIVAWPNRHAAVGWSAAGSVRHEETHLETDSEGKAELLQEPFIRMYTDSAFPKNPQPGEFLLRLRFPEHSTLYYIFKVPPREKMQEELVYDVYDGDPEHLRWLGRFDNQGLVEVEVPVGGTAPAASVGNRCRCVALWHAAAKVESPPDHPYQFRIQIELRQNGEWRPRPR